MSIYKNIPGGGITPQKFGFWYARDSWNFQIVWADTHMIFFTPLNN